MRRAVIVSIITVMIIACTVSAAYAYDASYNDSFDGQDISKKYCVLLSKNFSGTITVNNKGNALFNSREYLEIGYYDNDKSQCYFVVTLSGVGSGKTLSVTVEQSQNSKIISFTGTAVSDSEGNATVSGLGLINSLKTATTTAGYCKVYATISDYTENSETKTITISAYPGNYT